MNKYKKYIIVAVGFVVTALLVATLIYLNKKVFVGDFTSIENYKVMKRTTNNLLGFNAIIVVFSTLLLFIRDDSNKEK